MKRIIPSLFIFFAVLVLLYLINPAIFGRLTGAFNTVVIPNEYEELSNFLDEQNDYFRTLWIPTIQRFAYFSNNHPAIPAANLFDTDDPASIAALLMREDTRDLLQKMSVKYIIVPFDSDEDIFITDREFDKEKYHNTVSSIRNVTYLREIPDFHDVKIFEVPNSRDHFWIEGEGAIAEYEFINPTRYRVKIENAKRGDVLVFSESYDARWYGRKADTDESQIGKIIFSSPYERRLNSFALREDGDYILEVFYSPQKWVDIGMLISILTFTVCIVILVIIVRKKK